MKLYLVRHAKAENASREQRCDELRRLTKTGLRQAAGVAQRLADFPITRIVSSPHVRCRQTMEPLAAQLQIPVELDDRLVESARVGHTLNLLRSLEGEAAVLCSHGPVIAALLEQLLGDEELTCQDEVRYETGSVWSLERSGEANLRASYLPPLEHPTLQAIVPPVTTLGPDSARAGTAPSRVAVLDLGSTSFHLLVAEATSDGGLKRICRERVMLRLGAELAQDSRIPNDVCERAVEAAAGLRRAAEKAKANRLIPVATAALREAENGQELADRLGEVLGVPVWILDGAQEARMIFTALRRRVDPGPGSTLGLDLGGGSLELAVGDQRDIRWESTLRLGVARLHGELVRSDPMNHLEADSVRQRVRTLLEPDCVPISRLRTIRCVVVGGTVGALARLILARRGRESNSSVGGMRITLDELTKLCAELLPSSHDERLRMPGMEARRADLVPTGALILKTVLRQLDFEEITVCDWGVREGVFLLETLGA